MALPNFELCLTLSLLNGFCATVGWACEPDLMQAEVLGSLLEQQRILSPAVTNCHQLP